MLYMVMNKQNMLIVGYMETFGVFVNIILFDDEKGSF